MDIGRYSAQLNEDRLEQEFRDTNYKNKRRNIRIAFIIVLLTMGMFAINDYENYGFSDIFYTIIWGRILLIASTFAMLITINKTKKFKTHDIVMLVWGGVISIATILLNYFREDAITYIIFSTPLLLIIFYLFFSYKLIYKLINSLFFSLLSISVFFILDADIESRYLIFFIFLLLLLNPMGLLKAYQNDIHIRKEFLLLKNEQAKNEELTKAMEEIKVLKGLLPICASCKSIKNDEGYWQRMESYIQEHSLAKFTHTVCCDCAEKLYGEEEWFQSIKDEKKCQ